MSQLYSFTITIEGAGETPEEAWADATLDLALHGSDMPEYQMVEDVEC